MDPGIRHFLALTKTQMADCLFLVDLIVIACQSGMTEEREHRSIPV